MGKWTRGDCQRNIHWNITKGTPWLSCGKVWFYCKPRLPVQGVITWWSYFSFLLWPEIRMPWNKMPLQTQAKFNVWCLQGQGLLFEFTSRKISPEKKNTHPYYWQIQCYIFSSSANNWCWAGSWILVFVSAEGEGFCRGGTTTACGKAFPTADKRAAASILKLKVAETALQGIQKTLRPREF